MRPPEGYERDQNESHARILILIGGDLLWQNFFKHC